MHSEEELYNAAHALVVRDGGWDLAATFRYQNECGGCAVVAALGAGLFSVVPPSIGAWRSIGLLFFTFALAAGLTLGWRVARFRGAAAMTLVFAAAPPAYQRLALIVNGNHSEGGALLLVEVALAAAAATASTPIRRTVFFVLLLAAMSAGVPFLLSLQLGLVLPVLVILLAAASRWERFALWPSLLLGGSIFGLLPYGGLIASLAQRGAGSHESGQLVLSSSFIGRNLWTLIAPPQLQGIWGTADGPLAGRLGWLSFAALCVLLFLGCLYCVRELQRTRTLSLPSRSFLFPVSTVVAFVGLYLLYERQIGSGSGAPSPGQIRYLGLIYPTALCSAALAASLAAQREGPQRIAAGVLLAVLLLPGFCARVSDVSMLESEGPQSIGRYAPASAYGVDMIERLGGPLERVTTVGRLDLAGMARGRAAVRDGAVPRPIGDERVKEAWASGVLRELMGPGFNSARSPVDLLRKLRPQADGGPSAEILAALGVDEPRQGGANTLDRWLLRNLWAFQRNTLQSVHFDWDEESLAKLLPTSPDAPPTEAVDPYGFAFVVSAAGLGVEFGPLASRQSERLVLAPGALTLWRGAAPPAHLLKTWSWAWGWGLGAELGLRKGPEVSLVDLAVEIPTPTLIADDAWPAVADVLAQGLAEGYSYGSWFDWTGSREAPPPEVQVSLLGAGRALYVSAPVQVEQVVQLPSFRTESTDPGLDRTDSVFGGNGLEWRDLRGGSPRDFPGEVSFLGDVSKLSFCTLDSGRSCVPLFDSGESCADALTRSGAGQTTLFPVDQTWMSTALACRPAGTPFPDLPQDLRHALTLGAQLLVGPSTEPEGSKFPFGPKSVLCAEEGLAAFGRGLGRLGQDIGRELFLQSAPLLAESATGLEVARLPAHLVDLPQSLSSARAHLLSTALRSRGRRGVMTLGADASPALPPSRLVDHLVWGGAVQVEAEPLPGDSLALLAFGAKHRDLVGMAESPLGVVFSLTAWRELSAPERVELLERSEALLVALARAGVPYEVVVFGTDHRGPSPVETAALALQRFDHLVSPQLEFPPAEHSALTKLAEGKSGLVGFVGSAASPPSEPSGFKRWASPEKVVQSMRQAGLSVALSRALPREAQVAVHVSRHVVARDGGAAFHLVPQAAGPVSLGVSIPRRLVPRVGVEWWFHQPGGKGRLLSASSDLEGDGVVNLALPRFSEWGILEARPSRGVGGVPDLQVIGSRERTVFVSVWDDPGDEELALIFPENLSPWPKDHKGFEWTVDASGLAAEFKWPVSPVSVAGNIHLVDDRIDLEVTFTNHSSEAFEKVYSGLCLAPNSEKGFPGRFHERSWLIGPDGPRSLAELRTSSGASPLHVETNQFSWPVVIEESVGRDRSMAIAFDGASGVGGNAWGASVCLHIRPTIERIEPGASATLRGAIYFVDGSVELAVRRLEQEGWGGPARRFGPVPDNESFVDGLPPRHPPICAGMTSP